jgi:hypothetical protein
MLRKIVARLKLYGDILTSHASYERVFTRVNRLRPFSVCEKARRILGWIGCSPAAMTQQEMEHALLINADEDPEDTSSGINRLIVSGSLNIVRLCGPIVEMIDDRPQFVHFTVTE